MEQDLIRKYAAPVPRYTSYPTAPHFSPRVGPQHYAQWLAELPAGSELSVYVHIPYCRSLCWYCGCNTKATRRYAPVSGYLGALLSEIQRVAQHVPRQHSVAHLHWGGGSPSLLQAGDMAALSDALKSAFRIQENAEFAVEVDPRDCDGDRIAALHAAGVTRISLGVQDFNAEVQAAIGRLQTYERTRAVVDAFRAQGLSSINIDLMYGLPLQTRASVAATAEKVIALQPDRVAIFGYAHLPQRLRHQRLIPAFSLPDPVDRFAQAKAMAQLLEAAGYVRIGLDHYARPGDPLLRGAINRNFQGYTSDTAQTLIGLGASAIGRLPEGFVQNAVAPADYERRLSGGFATAKGLALSDDDRARAWVIKELMCSLRFSETELRDRFPAQAGPLIATAQQLIAGDGDDLIAPTSDGFTVPERGRPFLRSLCASFDAYLGNGAIRHAAGV